MIAGFGEGEGAPCRAGPSEHELYQRRQVAESFGSGPERYDRSPKAADGIRQACRVGAAIDAAGGSFTVRYTTTVVTAVLTTAT